LFVISCVLRTVCVINDGDKAEGEELSFFGGSTISPESGVEEHDGDSRF